MKVVLYVAQATLLAILLRLYSPSFPNSEIGSKTHSFTVSAEYTIDASFYITPISDPLLEVRSSRFTQRRPDIGLLTLCCCPLESFQCQAQLSIQI